MHFLLISRHIPQNLKKGFHGSIQLIKLYISWYGSIKNWSLHPWGNGFELFWSVLCGPATWYINIKTRSRLARAVAGGRCMKTTLYTIWTLLFCLPTHTHSRHTHNLLRCLESASNCQRECEKWANIWYLIFIKDCIRVVFPVSRISSFSFFRI